MLTQHATQTAVQSPPEGEPVATTLLNHLRFTALACRVKPRTDLFEACALLQTTRDLTVQSYAEALTRCLHQAIGQPPRFHAPGTPEMTWDEAWLVSLTHALAIGDEHSTAFLIRSRVARDHQRLIRFLVSQIARHFEDA